MWVLTRGFLLQSFLYFTQIKWPDLAKCSLKLHSNIQRFYLLFQVPKEYPFNNLYLERGGDPNKDPSEEKHTSNKIISNNVYGCQCPSFLFRDLSFIRSQLITKLSRLSCSEVDLRNPCFIKVRKRLWIQNSSYDKYIVYFFFLIVEN